MPLELSPVEARILGCLIEKERTTPEVYPLTLNSLTTACNQSTNRDPIVNYDDRLVEAGLDSLREKKLAMIVHGADVNADIDMTPEAAGLKAIAFGFAIVHGENDHLKIALESPLYDALYAWCQRDVAKVRPAE